MKKTELEILAIRRDRVILAAKVLLLGATTILLLLMAFYDSAADGFPVKTILLTTRTSFIVWGDQIAVEDVRRIWGGPSTLFGAKALVATFAILSVVAFARAWVNHGRFSRLGAALAASAALLVVPVLAAKSLAIFPFTIKPAALEALSTAIEQRQPGLVKRIRMGERPSFPAAGGDIRAVRLIPVFKALPSRQKPMLRDLADIEGLRFALAQQAWLAGDVNTLKRLLPISLPMPPTDFPARNDFARRLAAMGIAAHVAPVPPAELSIMNYRLGSWNSALSLIRETRVLIQISLWSGLLCMVLGLILRRSHRRIEAKLALLPTAAANPPKTFGRRNNPLSARR